MIGSSVLRYMFAATMVAAQSVAAATPSDDLDSRPPKLLNHPKLDSRLSGEDGVFLVSWGTDEFPKGTRMIGPRLSGGRTFTFCLNTAVSSEGLPRHSKPGECLAYAFPMPEAEIVSRPDGTFWVPQAQPFYLIDRLPIRD